MIIEKQLAKENIKKEGSENQLTNLLPKNTKKGGSKETSANMPFALAEENRPRDLPSANLMVTQPNLI